MGGLARRVSYLKLFSEKQKGVPALLVDAGNSLTDERNYHADLRPDVAAKDKWIFDAHDRFRVDVVNLSSHELRFASRFLQKARADKGPPVVDRLVSANIAAASPEFDEPKPYLVREVAAKGGSIRVAFIGLTETSPAPPRGFNIGDPADAARSAVEAARKQADVVVGVARVSLDEAERIAQRAPGLDALIATGADSVAQFFTTPRIIGNTFVVFGTFETRMLGELRFYRQPGGRFGTKVRYITLDEAVPDDPAGLDFAKRALAAEEEARAASKLMLNDWLDRSRQFVAGKQGNESGYSGSASCGACHAGQYVKWSSGKHAHATDPLVQRAVEIDASCFGCHASARDQAGSLPQVQGIECERCHGPGAAHAAKPGPGYGALLKSEISNQNSGRLSYLRGLCSHCHTADVNPHFEFEVALKQIKH